MHIKEGDNVRILTGKDRGKEGKVVQVFPKEGRVIVENMNTAVKHLRARGDQKGQRVDYSAPIHLSNVQLIAKDGTRGRIGYKRLEKDGKADKVRIVKKAGKTHDVN